MAGKQNTLMAEQKQGHKRNIDWELAPASLAKRLGIVKNLSNYDSQPTEDAITHQNHTKDYTGVHTLLLSESNKP